MNNPDTGNAELAKAVKVAEFRFGLVAPVIQGLFPDASRAEYYRRITEKPFTLPDGSTAAYKPKTVEKWVSIYNRPRDGAAKGKQERFWRTAKERLIYGLDMDEIHSLQLILCGETHFISTLRRPVHEALRQRITVHYEFQGLSDEEVPEYVRHKIRSAGGSTEIINEAAMAALNSMSQHNPRIIDNTMRSALTIAMQEHKAVIDPDVIMASVNHLAFS